MRAFATIIFSIQTAQDTHARYQEQEHITQDMSQQIKRITYTKIWLPFVSITHLVSSCRLHTPRRELHELPVTESPPRMMNLHHV